MAMPRSGSSMTAGIFAQHGVWVGHHKAGGRNPKGSFENTVLRNLVMTLYDGKGLVERGETAQPIPAFRKLVENAIHGDGYRGGPWLWKGSVMYWPAWFQFEPTWVVCRRPTEAIFQSSMREPYVYSYRDAGNVYKAIERHQAELDKLAAKGAHVVDTQAVAMGDFDTIRSAIEGCGLEFDESATAAFVDKDQWHHKA